MGAKGPKSAKYALTFILSPFLSLVIFFDRFCFVPPVKKFKNLFIYYFFGR